jgi:hypothetical protein
MLFLPLGETTDARVEQQTDEPALSRSSPPSCPPGSRSNICDDDCSSVCTSRQAA